MKIRFSSVSSEASIGTVTPHWGHTPSTALPDSVGVGSGSGSGSGYASRSESLASAAVARARPSAYLERATPDVLPAGVQSADGGSVPGSRQRCGEARYISGELCFRH